MKAPSDNKLSSHKWSSQFNQKIPSARLKTRQYLQQHHYLEFHLLLQKLGSGSISSLHPNSFFKLISSLNASFQHCNGLHRLSYSNSGRLIPSRNPIAKTTRVPPFQWWCDEKTLAPTLNWVWDEKVVLYGCTAYSLLSLVGACAIASPFNCCLDR